MAQSKHRGRILKYNSSIRGFPLHSCLTKQFVPYHHRNIPNFATSIHVTFLNRINASLIQLLLAKNVSFCLYRFPFELDVHLALEKDCFDSAPQRYFWIAPFVNTSSAREIFLHCVDKESEFDSVISKIQYAKDTALHFPGLPKHTSKKEYMDRLERYLHGINEGKMRKAILSRVKKIPKPNDFHPYRVFKKLCITSSQAFIYLFNNPDSGMWIGATPELLLLKKNNLYNTMALAGTQLTSELHQYSWRQKEIEEQHMVEQHVESIFEKYQFHLQNKNGPTTVEAGPVAHLRTDYEFFEKYKTNLESLLKDLHPTPAVGGLPSGDALDFILQNEGYDRKYYCGFLGETDFEANARLFINLRCMQIGKEEIAIYCGGGITADSDPESEWEETVQKSRAMLNILKVRNEVV